MGSVRLTLLAAVAALAAGCDDARAPDRSLHATASGEDAVVARVNDGDTLTLRNGVKVRLVQIDAPELLSDCYGRESWRVLMALTPAGARVRLVRDPALDARDQHGRLLRYVIADRRNVNIELVRQGAASPYFFRGGRGRHAAALSRAVAAARKYRRGYWRACPGARLDTRVGSVTGPA